MPGVIWLPSSGIFRFTLLVQDLLLLQPGDVLLRVTKHVMHHLIGILSQQRRWRSDTIGSIRQEPRDTSMYSHADFWMRQSGKKTALVEVRIFGQIFAVHRGECRNTRSL